MFDVGAGEFLVIAIIAVLLLGPDRLPKAVAEAARWLRVLRDQAANARREIVHAADLDPSVTDDLRRTVQDLADLHPRRLASSILSDSGTAPAAGAPVTPPVAPPPPTPVNGFGASAVASSFAPRPADAAPSTGPAATAAFDADAT